MFCGIIKLEVQSNRQQKGDVMSASLAKELIKALVLSLTLTIIIETGVFLLAGKRNKRDLRLVILVNIVTNPAVVLLYWLAALHTVWNLTLVAIPLEISAFLVEGCYYRKYGEGFRRPFLFALIANAVSFGLGLLLRTL